MAEMVKKIVFLTLFFSFLGMIFAGIVNFAFEDIHALEKNNEYLYSWIERLVAIEKRLSTIETMVKSPVIVQLVSADGTSRYAVGGNAGSPSAPKINDPAAKPAHIVPSSVSMPTKGEKSGCK